MSDSNEGIVMTSMVLNLVIDPVKSGLVTRDIMDKIEVEYVNTYYLDDLLLQKANSHFSFNFSASVAVPVNVLTEEPVFYTKEELLRHQIMANISNTFAFIGNLVIKDGKFSITIPMEKGFYRLCIISVIDKLPFYMRRMLAIARLKYEQLLQDDK